MTPELVNAALAGVAGNSDGALHGVNTSVSGQTVTVSTSDGFKVSGSLSEVLSGFQSHLEQKKAAEYSAAGGPSAADIDAIEADVKSQYADSGADAARKRLGFL